MDHLFSSVLMLTTAQQTDPLDFVIVLVIVIGLVIVSIMRNRKK